jgi:uncharacterized protein
VRFRSALYEGSVTHRRVLAPAHAFRYRALLTLLDLDEIEALEGRLRLFGRAKARPLRFRDEDHLAGSAAGVRRDLEDAVRREGLPLPGGRVELLTSGRILGHVFNPVSFFYCYDADLRLRLVVAEVNNTFGDRHAYVLPVEGGSFEWARKKLLHVSPFTRPDAGTYRFALPPPGERAEAVIDLVRGGRTVIATRLSLERREIDDRAIASALLRFPLHNLKVVAAIHWEALRLWAKGAPFWPQPPYDPAAARGGPA